MGKRLLAILGAFALVVSLTTAAFGSQREAPRDAADASSDGIVTEAQETNVAPDDAPDDQQHGTSSGHLAGTRKNVKLISKLRLTDTEGGIADVGYFKGYAYLAAWGPECPDSLTDTSTGGVHIVDVRNQRNPKKVGFLSAGPKDYVGEGVHLWHARTRDEEGGGVLFEGDLLVVNHEECGSDGLEGMSLYDVSNPRAPEPLAQHFGDRTTPLEDNTGGVRSYHSAMGWSARGRAYVVGVDNDESGTTDVDIFDVTNPAEPQLISEVGLETPEWEAEVSVDGRGESAFHHDMEVRKIDGHWMMMVSYWDAGWVQLNVDDPANPTVVRESDFGTVDPEFDKPDGTPWDPEGNAHQGEWNWNANLFVGTSEDFAPYRPQPLEITTGPNVGSYAATAVGGAAPVTFLPDRKLNGPVVYGGYGCPDDPTTPTNEGSKPVPQRSAYDLGLAEGEEAILVMQRGPTNDPNNPEGACFPGQKADAAKAAGWDAVVLVNRHISNPEPLPPFCGSGAFTQPIVAVCTTHEAFHKMFNEAVDYTTPYPPTGSPADQEPALGQRGERVEVDALFDGWGYVFLLGGNGLRQLDTYVAAPTRDPENGVGEGTLSVHEVATDRRKGKNIGYLSYYGAGLRVIKFNRERGIREVGRYIHVNGNDFWGVQLVKRRAYRPLILMSDRDHGLWIFKYTGRQ